MGNIPKGHKFMQGITNKTHTLESSRRILAIFTSKERVDTIIHEASAATQEPSFKLTAQCLANNMFSQMNLKSKVKKSLPATLHFMSLV